MTPPLNRRTRPRFTWPTTAPRTAFTLLAFALAVLAFLAFAWLGTAPSAADAAVLVSEVPGAHFRANDAAQIEINRVRSRIRLENLPGAIDAAEAAVLKDSLSGEAWDLLGTLELRRENHRAAHDAFRRAAVLAPDQAAIWNRLAQVSILHLGYEEEALQALAYAHAADSLYATAWYTMSLYRWTRAELDAAEEAILRARAIETDETRSVLWYSAWIGLSLARGRYSEAASALAVHLYSAPGDLAARQHYAHALRGLGRLDEAKAQLGLLLKSANKQPVWLVESGLVLRAEGKRDSARMTFERAVKADSGSFDAGYNLAFERAALGDTVGAWKELRRLRVIDATNFLVPLYASRLARAAGDSTRAALAFEEARRLHPALGLATAAEAGASAPIPAWSSPDLAEGERLMERGEFTLASDRFTMAAEDPVRRAAALYWLARSSRMTGASRGLPVIAAQAGAEASRGDPVLLRTLAEAQWDARDPARAVPNLRTVRRLAPTDLVAAAVLSEVLLETGDGAGARGVWNEVAQEPTRSWRVESSRAAAFAAANDAGAAIARQRAAAVDYLAPAP